MTEREFRAMNAATIHAPGVVDRFRPVWAEISEFFLSSEAGSDTLLEASPRLYDLLRAGYERHDLLPAAERSA